MANSIVKEMRNPDDPQGPRIPTTDGVIRYLMEGKKQLGDIRKFLSENDAKYTKPGLILLLKRLMKNREIRKHSPKHGYPTYYITPKIKDNIPLQAKMFAIEASNALLQKGSPSSDPKNILTDLIQKIGFYTVFNYLHSWELRQKDSNHLQVEWLENTLPMRKVSFYLTGRDIWEPKNVESKIKEFEKVLEDSYPNEYKECKLILSELVKSTEDFFTHGREKGTARVITQDL